MKNGISDSLIDSVAMYYSDKLLQHGETPQGVDWNGVESQVLRFVQLCQIIAPAQAFTLLDFGCGFGSLYEYLSHNFRDFAYLGLDVSPDMIAAAKNRYPTANAKFVNSSQPPEPSDYALASGIFNVRLEHTDTEWLSYIEATIAKLNAASRKGFAFNCLTSYSDRDKQRDYLYYAEPGYLFDLCKRQYSRNVALLHDYELYEFTILVRK
ncbi:MAG: class I SAM-dependent methyltransferase [Candidatus Pacebacteria bacterium]|nr:class I SAM-dependent methyltransferase [Candidatus Paceibacterota bacterium]